MNSAPGDPEGDQDNHDLGNRGPPVEEDPNEIMAEADFIMGEDGYLPDYEDVY